MKLVCEEPIYRGPNKGRSARGTVTGRSRHWRVGESPCSDCQSANAQGAREWERNNPERLSERRRRNYWADPEKARKRVREYAQEHKVERAQALRQWQKENPEKVAIYNARRRARKSAVLSIPFTNDQLEARMEYYGNRCYIRIHCDGAPYESVDHVIPLSKGGPHCLANLRPSCLADNSAKGNLSLQEVFHASAS